MKSSPASLPPGFGELLFETTASFGQEASWWTENSPDCLLICLPPDDLMQSYFLTKLRADVPRQLPIVLLSPSISVNLMHLSQVFGRVRMLKVPVEGMTVLRTIVELTTQWAAHETQIHPRYLTDQPVIVSSELTTGSLHGKMRNMSLSGAYFEAENDTLRFKSGDILKMSVQVGNPPKDYVFDAKVVWMKPLDGAQGNGYGVAFVNKEEVYNHLLKGF